MFMQFNPRQFNLETVESKCGLHKNVPAASFSSCDCSTSFRLIPKEDDFSLSLISIQGGAFLTKEAIVDE